MTATGIPVTTSASSWNRSTHHVEAGLLSGRYINAETTLLCAGPPRVSDIGANTVASTGGINTEGVLSVTGQDFLYPIGMVESFGIQQVHNANKIFEIGSRRSYQVGGRVQVVGNMGRVMFYGPSLLRVLYAYYPNTIQMANGQLLGPGGDRDSVSEAMAGATSGSSDMAQLYPQIFLEPGAKSGVRPGDRSSIPHSFFINLMSELFSHCFGLCVLMRDGSNRNYGAFYLEDCMINTHSIAWSATSTMITEAVNFQADAAVPMEFSTTRNGSVGPSIQLANGTV